MTKWNAVERTTTHLTCHHKSIACVFLHYLFPCLQTGHTHFYHRSCPVFKGGCRPAVEAKAGNKIYAPVHVMVGNGGFQPGASIFNTTPPWIDTESFAYGYCTVEASQTYLNLQVGC